MPLVFRVLGQMIGLVSLFKAILNIALSMYILNISLKLHLEIMDFIENFKKKEIVVSKYDF